MKNEMDEQFERRATRGAVRGADAVFEAASIGDYAPIELPRPRRRSAPVLVAAGVVALGVVGATMVLVADRDEPSTPTAVGADIGLAGECFVFVEPEAPDGRLAEIAALVAADPEVESAVTYTQQDAYAEFRRIFAHKPELVASVSPEVLPPSVRATLHESNRSVVDTFRDRYDGLSDVREARCDPPVWMGSPGEDEDCAVAPGAGAPDERIARIREQIEGDPNVHSYTFLDIQEVMADLREELAETPAMIETIGPDEVSSRLGVTLRDGSDAAKAAFLEHFLTNADVADAVCNEG